MKINIQIKHHVTGAILFEFEKEGNTQRDTILEAIKQKVNLSFADLSFADLSYADLSFAKLRSANLSFADLSSANLRFANLRFANLRFADLRSANLRSANLRFADLPDSYVNSASRDMLFIFEHLKAELPGLRKALVEGRVDGSQYEGECACLIGTLANVDGGLEKVCQAIPFYDKGTHNPAEAWFLNINEGDKPEDNQFAAHALKLIDMVLKPGKVKSKKK